MNCSCSCLGFDWQLQLPGVGRAAAFATLQVSESKLLTHALHSSQSLNAGLGEEVRLGRGFCFFKLELQLTELGESHVPHILGTLARAIQVR